MALLQTLKSLVNERLSAAAEEIFWAVGQIVTEYEDEALSLKQEIDHKNRLLDMVFKLYRTDILQLPLCKEEEQQTMISSLVQEEPNLPQIKEEHEELLLRPEEGLTSLAVKSEYDGDKGETEPVASSPDEHMKTQVDFDHLHSSHCSESHTDDSDDLEETSESFSNNLTQGLESTKQMKFHTEKKDFNCKDCGKMFSCKSKLKMHTMIHTDKKLFSCTVCGKGCVKAGNLKTHMMTHTGEMPLSCTVCGKGCLHNGHLKIHMMSHTCKRPFSCTVCGKGFVSECNLKTHTRTHTGERPFSCTVCGKGCLHMGDLKRHLRTHTGEKPFSCAVCGKSFSRTSTLKIHMKTHKGESL